MRIGVLDLTSPHWAAGGVFSRLMLEGLLSAQSSDQIFCLGDQGTRYPNFHHLPWKQDSPRPGEKWLRKILRRPPLGKIPSSADHYDLDVVMPVLYVTSLLDLTPKGRVATLGWIPDFQHLHLPEFFSEEECILRNKLFTRCANLNTRVLLSSNNAADHFREFLPNHASKASVAHFPSTLALDDLGGLDTTIAQRYGLPRKYILVVNQFWAHKNHLCVIEAAHILREQNIPATFVLVGHLAENRKHNGCIASQTLQAIARHGIQNSVLFLGAVPRNDLLQLLRQASVVLQPSLFEGWNTTVEDAKALGRPIVCSDIPVLREQAPHALFFHPNSPEQLAHVIREAWTDFSPEIEIDREKQYILASRDALRTYGEKLLAIARSCVPKGRSSLSSNGD